MSQASAMEDHYMQPAECNLNCLAGSIPFGIDELLLLYSAQLLRVA